MGESAKKAIRDLRKRDAQMQADLEQARISKVLARQRERMRHAPEEDANESEGAQWIRNTLEWNANEGLWELPHASYSDYHGSYVDKANSEAFKELFPELVETSGGRHGSTVTGIGEDNRKTISEEDYERLKETVEGLENYPLIDEDKHSTMQMEARWEYWKEYGRDGVREALVKKFAGNTDVQIAVVLQDDSFWDTMCREKDWDQYINEETGLNMYMREESVVQRLSEDEFYIPEQVAAFKRHLFFKEGADDFSAVLNNAGIAYDSDEALWALFSEAEAKLEVWEVKDRFFRRDAETVYDQADKEDAVTLDTNAFPELVQHLAPDAALQAKHRQRAADPRQQAFFGFESKAQALVASLLEEDPKRIALAAKQATPDYRAQGVKKIEIWGRRWFRRGPGNTYFTSRIYVNDELVHTMPMEYGYGNHYEDQSFEWLEQNGYVKREHERERPWRWAERTGIEYSAHAEDVRRQRDLFQESAKQGIRAAVSAAKSRFSLHRTGPYEFLVREANGGSMGFLYAVERPQGEPPLWHFMKVRRKGKAIYSLAYSTPEQAAEAMWKLRAPLLQRESRLEAAHLVLDLLHEVQDPQKCAACGGKCCMYMPGITSPEDWGAPDKAAMLKKMRPAIQSGGYELHDWYGDPVTRSLDSGGTIWMPRPSGSAFGYGHRCNSLTAKGCAKSYLDRPRQCRDLAPGVDPAKTGCEGGYTNQQAAIDWVPYQDVVSKAANYEEPQQEASAKRVIQQATGAAHRERIRKLLYDFYGTDDHEEISLNAAGRRTGTQHEETDQGGVPFCKTCGRLDRNTATLVSCLVHPDQYLNP